MFCACIGILICLLVIITGAAISSVDVVRYDFGLYYILIAIVGTMGSLTLCVIRPTKFCGVTDPRWYTNICGRIHRALLNAQEKRLAAQQRELELAEAGSVMSCGPTVISSKKPGGGGNRQRATLMMLGPAVELMHHVIHGVAEGKEETTEEDKSSMQSEMDGPRPSLWWDSFQAATAAAMSTTPLDTSTAGSPLAGRRARRKRKRRPPRGATIDFDLYTITSVSSDVITLGNTNCNNQNVVSTPTSARHLLLRPLSRTSDKVTIKVDDGTSEVFL